MSFEITILQLYPDELNVYGDNGNFLALKQRAQWRDISVNIIRHNIGSDFSKYKPDIILGGGGQDSNQLKITDDLEKIAPRLKQWIEDDTPCLFICGSYQVLGAPYQNLNGQTIPGTNILDIKTVASNIRSIGNITVESPEFGRIVGYENHSGQTYLGKNLAPLGKVMRGFGNNGKDGQEGLRYKNLIGTYCHGPILPKNPRVADFLLGQALRRKYGDTVNLTELDDSTELSAQEQSAKRPR